MSLQYTTAYDVGAQKRESGINEDSVAITVFEQGHRDGYAGPTRSNADDEDRASDTEDETEKPEEQAGNDSTAESDSEESSASDLPSNRSIAVFALADGAGGHDAGDLASYVATAVICEELADVALRIPRSDPSPFGVEVPEKPEPPSDADLRESIDDAIDVAHREILEASARSGGGAYTTVVAGIVADGRLHYGWVGDSRAYLVNRSRESIVRLTEDHAVVDELLAQGVIDPLEARVHPRNNEITRALGGPGAGDPTSATVPVETRTVPLYADDILLVTSDGLIDAQTDAPALYDEYVESDRSDEVAERIRKRVVTDADLRDIVLDAENISAAADSLIEMANDRGGKDNLSVLLVSDPALDNAPADVDLSARDVANQPIEDRETVIVPDE